MSMDNLFQALNMFKQGAQELAISRAIAGANEQVAQIKGSELNEQQQRAQLQQVSNALVGQMSGMGAPATTVAQVAGTIAPKHFADANAMNTEALLTGDTKLGELAKQQQQFQFDLEEKKALAEAKRNPYTQLLQQQRQQAADEKALTDLFNKANPALTSRSTIAVLKRNLNRVQEAEAILHGDPAKLSRQNVEELPKIIDSILSGGVGTVSGTEHLRPEALNIRLAKLQEIASSSPQPANVPGFVEMYADTIDRMKGIIAGQIKKDIRTTLKAGGADVAGRNEASFRERANALLSPYGGDNIVSIDPKTKQIRFESDDAEEHLLAVLKEVAANPQDPRAAAAYQKAQDDPHWFGAVQRDPKLFGVLRKKFGGARGH